LVETVSEHLPEHFLAVGIAGGGVDVVDAQLHRAANRSAALFEARTE
jgi:hypothetical protein